MKKREPPRPATLADLGLELEAGGSVAQRRLADGSFLALSGLEIERFLIVPHGGSGETLREALQAAWSGVVDALAQLSEPLEFWHVLATRQQIGPDGAALRAGWLAIGRASSQRAAARAALRTLGVLRAVQSAHLGFATLRPVTDTEVLLDLAQPLGASSLRSFRRRRWQPPTRARREPASDGGGRPGTLLPWRAEGLSWAPLAEALAALAKPAAFVVRVRTGLMADPGVVTRAEQDVVAAMAEAEALRGCRVDRVTVAPLEPVLDELRTAAETRLRTLSGPCFALDASLACSGPIGPGLSAMAAAALTAAASVNRQRGPERPGEPGPSLPPPGLQAVDLPPDALGAPLPPDPELLASPREAPALLRTADPPGDERSPLPCARARSLPVRSVPAKGTLLGDAEQFGAWREVRLSETARFQHAYLVGQTGTGKSTLMLNMILDDLRAGHGLTVLDPHGTLIADVLARLPRERADDVLLLDLADIDHAVGLNPLDLRADDAAAYVALRDRVIDELLDTFDALYDLKQTGGPQFEQHFRTFVSLVMGGSRPPDYVPTLPMIEQVMTRPRLIDSLLERLQQHDPTVSTRVESMRQTTGDQSLANFVPYITSKMCRFYAHAQARRILCQPRGLDFARVLGERRVLLVELSKARLGSEAAALMARQITLRLTEAAMTRPTARAVPHFVYADEFHNFATERFAQLLAEARKFRLGLVLAHQYTTQLVKAGDRRVLEAVLGNVGTFIAFRVGAQDAALLEDVMAPRADAADISGLPNHWACVRSVGGLGNVPFTLRTRPADPGLTGCSAQVRERSREREGLPRQDVDRAIAENLAAFQALEPHHREGRSRLLAAS
jgi:hypothetical protein